MTPNTIATIILVVVFAVWLVLTVAMVRVCVIPLFCLWHKFTDKKTPELNKYSTLEME